MACTPPVDVSAYEPPVSLWTLIEQYAPAHELGELKDMLGWSDVEQSVELHREVDTLLEIWRDFREETQRSMFRRLPEPPEVRDRLKREIQFFVENIRNKAHQNGRDPELVLGRHNTDLILYAVSDASTDGLQSRPSTSRSSREGRDTPLRPYTPSSGRMSTGSTISEELDGMNDKLTYLEFGQVVQRLRSTLTEEISQLLEDITFLHGCLDDEVDYRAGSAAPNEPSLAELKTERSQLEKDLLSNESLRQEVPLPATNQKLINQRKLPELSKIRPSPPNSANKSLRPGPMRASHTITPSVIESQKPPTVAGQETANKRIANSQSHVRSTIVHSPQYRRLSPESNTAPNTSQLVHVYRGRASDIRTSPSPPLTPSPPSSAGRPPRTGSASRFRKLVASCRDDP